MAKIQTKPTTIEKSFKKVRNYKAVRLRHTAAYYKYVRIAETETMQKFFTFFTFFATF